MREKLTGSGRSFFLTFFKHRSQKGEHYSQQIYMFFECWIKLNSISKAVVFSQEKWVAIDKLLQLYPTYNRTYVDRHQLPNVHSNSHYASMAPSNQRPKFGDAMQLALNSRTEAVG